MLSGGRGMVDSREGWLSEGEVNGPGGEVKNREGWLRVAEEVYGCEGWLGPIRDG